MRKLLLLGAVLLAPLPGFAGSVDINSADAATIARELNGIGMARAQAIVEYRKVHGAFSAAEDVLKVKGVGPYVLDSNKGLILVENSSQN